MMNGGKAAAPVPLGRQARRTPMKKETGRIIHMNRDFGGGLQCRL